MRTLVGSGVSPSRARRHRRFRALVLSAVASWLSSPAASATFTPAQVSVSPKGAQLPTSEMPVRGFSFNPFIGVQEDVAGLEIGLVNVSERQLKGVGLGMSNTVKNDVAGLQVATSNVVGRNVVGAQIGALASRAGGNVTGLQVAAFSEATAELHGSQISPIASFADKCVGVQVGLIFARANSGTCLQIGLLNANPGGLLPLLPLVNASFK